MVYTAIGITLLAFLMFLMRMGKADPTRGIWRILLWCAILLVIGCLALDSITAGFFQWSGEDGLVSIAIGDTITWGSVSVFAFMMAMRASRRIQQESEAGGSIISRPTARLDLMMVIVAGVLLYKTLPGCLDSISYFSSDLSAPPVSETVKVSEIREHQNTNYRGFSDQREIVLIREKKEPLVIPIPTKAILNDDVLNGGITENEKTFRTLMEIRNGDMAEITYYPESKVVVSFVKISDNV